MNRVEITKKLEENTVLLFEYLDGLDTDILNKKPSETEWSVLENLEHLIIIEKSCGYLFAGDSEVVAADRLAQFNRLKGVANTNGKKIKANEKIQPSGRISNLEMGKEAMKTARVRMLENGDWDKIYTKFGHFIFGYMTKAEWIVFCTYHTERHLQQMKNTVARLS